MAADSKARLFVALRQPVAALTVVQIASVREGQSIIDEAAGVLGERPSATIPLIAEAGRAGDCLDAARDAARAWTPDAGVVFLLDRTPPEPADAAAFWRAMNLLREQWAAVPAHIVFMLRPRNYEFLLGVADHLAAWMPLKLDLRGVSGELPTDLLQLPHEREIWTTPQDPASARMTLKHLEEDLAKQLETGDLDEANLSRKYYLPMAVAAISAHDLSRADRLLGKIDANVLSENDRLRFWWQKTFVALEQSNWDVAEVYTKQIMDWANANHSKAFQARAAVALSQVARNRGDYTSAEDWCRFAFIILHAEGDVEGMAIVYEELGLIAEARHALDDAKSHYESSLKLLESDGSASLRSAILFKLGGLALNVLDFDAAELRFKQSLDVALDSGLSNRAVISLCWLAHLRERQQDLVSAARYLVDALVLTSKSATANYQDEVGLVLSGLCAELEPAERAEVVAALEAKGLPKDLAFPESGASHAPPANPVNG